MAKKRNSSPAEERPSPASDGQTEYERQRAAIIAANRARLLALGIPALVAQLKQAVEAEQPTKKKKAAAKKEEGGKPKPRRGAEQPEQPPRRSSRLREAAEHPKPKPESAEERFERELGEFVVEGVCPRCGKELERGHRAHLAGCTGEKPERAPHVKREDAAAALSAEDRKSEKKRLLARMKQVSLDGLVGFSPEGAEFVVLGSKGDPYTIKLNDTKHTCTCMDYRFRRHNCKHICAALDHLGILDSPSEWRAAVEAQLDKLAQEARRRHRESAAQAAEAPRDREAEVAARFL